MGFVLTLMAFPLLFLNLIENGILPISSHDSGSNLNSSFEPFLMGKIKMKLNKPRE